MSVVAQAICRTRAPGRINATSGQRAASEAKRWHSRTSLRSNREAQVLSGCPRLNQSQRFSRRPSIAKGPRLDDCVSPRVDLNRDNRSSLRVASETKRPDPRGSPTAPSTVARDAVTKCGALISKLVTVRKFRQLPPDCRGGRLLTRDTRDFENHRAEPRGRPGDATGHQVETVMPLIHESKERARRAALKREAWLRWLFDHNAFGRLNGHSLISNRVKKSG